MKRYCLTLDLKNDDALIAEYEAYHKAVWPEVLESIKTAGITDMQIFRWQNRLCMVVEAEGSFSFTAKDAADAANEKVQAWEQRMWKYQQVLPGALPGQKWVLMDEIFSLSPQS